MTHQNQKPQEPSNVFIRVADLSHVWDCRCEIERICNCIAAVHMIACEYAKDDAFPLLILMETVTAKLNECNELLSQTINKAMEVKQ